MNKLDLILQEIRNLDSKINKKFGQIDEKFEQIDRRFEQIDKKFEQIDRKFEQIDKKFEQIDKRFEQIDKRLDAIDTRITILAANNLEEHNKIYSLLNSLNNSFLRFEAEINDKIKILFDGYEDLQNHKKIFSHEITNLNGKVSNLSFRVSKLENS